MKFVIFVKIDNNNQVNKTAQLNMNLELYQGIHFRPTEYGRIATLSHKQIYIS